MNAPPAHVYEFGDFRLDAEKRLLWREDAPVPLTSRVFETLLYMVEHHDTVLDKERLMEAVWPDSIVEENNLTQNISTLRRVFGETPGSHRFIVTVPGRGYRFVAECQITGGGCRPGAAENTGDRNRTGRDGDRTSCFGFSTGSPSRQPQFQANLAGDRSRARAERCRALFLARPNAKSA